MQFLSLQPAAHRASSSRLTSSSLRRHADQQPSFTSLFRLRTAMEAIPRRNERPEAMEFEGVGTGVDAHLGMTTGARAGRRDGREPSEMRPISLSQGVLTAADGSARIRVGATDVVVAVYGPIDCPVHRQRPDQLQVHVAFRRREGGKVLAARAAGAVNAGKEAIAARDLRNVVMHLVLATLHPRKAVVVAVQVLADNGGMLAAALNATVMALINAAVPMQAVPTAACLSVHNGSLVVDPVSVEEAEADAVLTFTFDTTLTDENGFISVYTDGDCGGHHIFEAAVQTSRELATKTRAFLKLSLEQKANQQHIWNTTSLKH